MKYNVRNLSERKIGQISYNRLICANLSDCYLSMVHPIDREILTATFMNVASLK